MMKKTKLSFFALIGFSISIHAQSVLQSADLLYNGDLNMIFIDYSDPGAEGADVSWDFSDAIITENATNFSFNTPSVSELETYPDANLSYNWGGSGRLFTHAPDQMQILGQYSAQATIVYSDPIVYFEFPVMYGDNYSDDFGGTNTNSIGDVVNTDGVFHFSVDAYGTLELPSGTYENVLRVKREYMNTISGMDFTVETIETDYEWYHPDYPTALLAMNRLTASASGELISASGVLMNIENVSVEDLSSSVVQLYPNPAGNQFYIDLSLDQETMVNVAVFDMLGRIIFTQETNLEKGEKLKIDTSNWEKSSYIVHLQAGEKFWNEKLSLF